MKIAGLKASEYLAVVTSQREREVETINGKLSCQLNVTHAFIGWHTRKVNYRPYLHLIGKVEGVNGRLPYGIHEVSLSDKEQIPFFASYEFSDAEIKQLIDKGLYHEGFKVPEVLTEYDTLLDVDLDVRMSILKPRTQAEIPLVFCEVENHAGLRLNSENSGYVLADYFEHQKKDVEKEVVVEKVIENEVAQEVVTELDEVIEEPDFVIEEVEEVKTKEELELDVLVDDLLEKTVKGFYARPEFNVKDKMEEVKRDAEVKRRSVMVHVEEAKEDDGLFLE